MAETPAFRAKMPRKEAPTPGVDDLSDLEGQICDLCAMAQILGELLERNIVEHDPRTGKAIARPKEDAFLTIRLNQSQIDGLGFAWNDVAGRAIVLKKAFYEALEGQAR